jgi:hypothetical protein
MKRLITNKYRRMASMAKTAAKKPAVKSTAAKSAAPAKAKKAEAPKKEAKAPKAAKVEVVVEAKAAKAAPEVEAKPAKAPKAPKVAKVPMTLAEKEAAKAKRAEEAKAKADRATLSEEEKKWSEFHEKHKSDKAQSYDMKATFEANKPLQHKILGWGWIMSNDNDRLEVLFKDGKKTLISNYNR